MSQAREKVIHDLLSDMEGMQQLASWQLALVRDVKDKIAGLGRTRGVPAPADRRRRRTKKP